MSEAFFEKIDLFLPGQGEELAQAPVYHWERAEPANAQIYYSTREPKSVLIHLTGLTREEREALADMPIEVDLSALKYHDFDGFGVHLPGLIVTTQGTAIAVCQKRHGSMGDGGNQVDILMSRSEDGGSTWQRQEVIFEEAGAYTYLGPIFEDCTTGAVFVAFWKMPADILDDLGYFSEYAKGGGGFYLLKSTDQGQTWSEPLYVSPKPNDEGWVGWPNNCVHGIQLVFGPRKGRLVIPAFLYKEGEPGQVPGVRGGLLYSDDGGQSWNAGAVLPEGSDEVSLVETAAGGTYVSYRKNTLATGKRHFARSIDYGETFSEHGQHEEVPDANLHAGLVRYREGEEVGDDILLFSNPSPAKDMTIRMSRDEGRSWDISRRVERGLSRYSDLAVTADGTILCLYTNGVVRDREKISVARFNLEWLADASD
jgi:sialidase-1